MLNAFKNFIESLQGTADGESGGPESHERSLRVATTALLVEMSRADFGDVGVEKSAILDLLERGFAMDRENAREMLNEADREARHAVSLHEFTSVLHEHMSAQDKLKVVEMLWRVAYADDHLDKHEEGLVRKIADLLYVPHRDLIRIRNSVAGL